MFSFLKINKPAKDNAVDQANAVDAQQFEQIKAKITSIKVLGSGCSKCHTLYENAREAVASMGLGIDVVYVTDINKIMAYNVMSTPCLVVNEQVLSSGKLLSSEQIVNAILNFAQK